MRVLLCTWLCAGVSARARADSNVVLLLEDPAQPRPRLAAALRIQLNAVAEVRIQRWSTTPALPERMREAHALAAGEAYAAVVWVEAGKESASHEAVLYVAGRRAGRALLELVRVPLDRSLDLERVLALKLSELLADLRVQRPAAELLETPVPPRPSPSPSSPRPATAPPPRAAEPAPAASILPSAELALGPRLSGLLSSSLTRIGLGARLTPQLCEDAWCLGLGLGLDGFPTVQRTFRGSLLNTHELSPHARVELSWRMRALAISAHTGAALALISVRGSTPANNSGTRNVKTWSWLVGLGVAHELTKALAVRANVDVVLHATRQRFEINGAEALDLGRAQLVLGIELVLRAPLSAAP